MGPPYIPLVWGHRGASADFPENTLASFESAARAGADGIESDVNITADDVILMFHDPELGRTTRGGKGNIHSQPYFGGIEHLRTIKEPVQKIPTFDELVEWLVRPENGRMVLNIDVKPGNDPKRLFSLMHNILAKHPAWETSLAPRIVLGLWHPRFVPHALEHLPQLKRCFIGIHLDLAQLSVFWDITDAYSIAFPILVSPQGRAFYDRCRKAGKEVYTWTLNSQEEWVTAAQMGVDVVMTDRPNAYLEFRQAHKDSNTSLQPNDPWWAWKNWKYYTPVLWFFQRALRGRLERAGGPLNSWFQAAPVTPSS